MLRQYWFNSISEWENLNHRSIAQEDYQRTISTNTFVLHQVLAYNRRKHIPGGCIVVDRRRGKWLHINGKN